MPCLPTILSPGVYQGGISIKGASVVVMLPGVYILEGGGLQVSGLSHARRPGHDHLQHAGAFAAGPITMTTLGKVTLTAPIAGAYQGIEHLSGSRPAPTDHRHGAGHRGDDRHRVRGGGGRRLCRACSPPASTRWAAPTSSTP